jgi:hypothetical protein
VTTAVGDMIRRQCHGNDLFSLPRSSLESWQVIGYKIATLLSLQMRLSLIPQRRCLGMELTVALLCPLQLHAKRD